jgi:hypothetical protein
MKKHLCVFIALAAIVALFVSSGPAPAYTVAGDFATPGAYTVSTGGDLWTLLKNTGGGIKGGTENAIEGDYVLVTGAGGSSALYAVGELDTKFSSQSVTLTASGSGFNLSGEGRSVTDVTGIDVIHAVNVIKGGTYAYSTALTVSGAGTTPKTYSLQGLAGMMPPSFYSGTSAVYWGPSLLSVLDNSGINTGNMDSYVIVGATDGYATVLSMYEVTHMTGAQYDLIAYGATDGELNQGTWINGTKGPANDDGFARLILPGDKGAGRWVSNVNGIEVVSVAPAPPSVFLLAPGLLGLFGIRRRFTK